MTRAQLSPDQDTYRLLVDAVEDYAIYLLDPEGRISTWNTGAKRIKGYDAEDVLGRPFSIFFSDEDQRRGLPRTAIETAGREGSFESEGWRVRKDGTRFWALAVVDAVRDRSGRLIGFAKITRDMTDRHTAQQALAESERRFRLLVEGVTDYAIFMLEPDGTVANWNTGARRIKGYEAAEIVGSHFSRFYTEDDREAGVPKRALAQAEATGRFEAEGWRVRKDGTRFWASVVIEAIRGQDGALLGFAKVTRDLTERREAQRIIEATRAQLAQSQKLEALGQLTGGVAHDFNNVLQVISSGLRLAEKLLPTDSRLAELYEEMRTSVSRAATLTAQLLAFSRQAPLRPELVSTAGAIRQAANLFMRLLPSSVTLEVEIDEGVWPIHVDVAQFEVAMLNLAANARDAMPRGGKLRVHAGNTTLQGGPHGLAGRFVAISVRDTGSGIPEEVLLRVFEPFFTTKPVGKGTGLGLSQVYGFAQQAGGAATVTSQVDEGTEVRLFLRAALPDAHDQLPASGEGQIASEDARAALRVLLVDDDPAVNRLTADMLEGSGHSATATTDPRVALDWLGEGQHFDLVLSDVLMPGRMNGVELARNIRQRWSDLPILLTTGYVGDAGLSLREFPVMQKPFTALELDRAMATVARSPHHGPLSLDAGSGGPATRGVQAGSRAPPKL